MSVTIVIGHDLLVLELHTTFKQFVAVLVIPCRSKNVRSIVKKDAAKNLRDRVSRRCRREDALRFDSLTFDALSKGLLNRFFQALPEIWRPTGNYEIYSPIDRSISEFFNTLLQLETNAVAKTAIRVFPRYSFMKACVLGVALPSEGIDATDIGLRAARKWWKGDLHGRKPSRLSFPMIGRLAELLLRVRPRSLGGITEFS